MGFYRVTVPVTRASGEQEFRVEADSPEEAKQKVLRGDVPVYDERLETESVGDVTEYEVEDLGADA
jgi:hypothetical protein